MSSRFREEGEMVPAPLLQLQGPLTHPQEDSPPLYTLGVQLEEWQNGDGDLD